MYDADDLDTYNGNPVHDMYVDFDYQINTDEDMANYIDNLNNWD